VQKRQAVLQLEMRHLLLLEKELEQEQTRIRHRLEELNPKPVLERFETLLPLPEAQRENVLPMLDSLFHPQEQWFPEPEDSTQQPSSPSSL